MVKLFCIALLFLNACLFGESAETTPQELCANFSPASYNCYPSNSYENNFGPFQGEVYYPQYSCCVPCTIAPVNCYNNFYVGVEGGWSTGLCRPNRVSDVGIIGFTFVGNVERVKTMFGHALGGEIGYRFSNCARVDLSYTFLNNEYNYKTHYGPIIRNPEFAKLDSHLVLLNGYFHFLTLIPTSCILERLNPYINAGIGVAINRLYDHREFSDLGQYISDIEPHTHANFGARIGAGLLIPVTQCVAFDVAFNANYINEVRSGDSRKLLSTQAVLPINTYVFKNNWIASLTFGAKFLF